MEIKEWNAREKRRERECEIAMVRGRSESEEKVTDKETVRWLQRMRSLLFSWFHGTGELLRLFFFLY